MAGSVRFRRTGTHRRAEGLVGRQPLVRARPRSPRPSSPSPAGPGWRWWYEQPGRGRRGDVHAGRRGGQGQGREEDRRRARKALIAKHPARSTRREAALVAAKAAFDAGNLDEARKQLEWVVDQRRRGAPRRRAHAPGRRADGAEEIRRGAHGARRQQGRGLSRRSVADLRGDVMLAQGRLDEARAAYKLAVGEGGRRATR